MVEETHTKGAAFSAEGRLQDGRWVAGGGLGERERAGMFFKATLTGRKGGDGRGESSSFLSFCPMNLKLPSSPQQKSTWSALVRDFFYRFIYSVLFRLSNIDATVIWRDKQTMSQVNGTFKVISGGHKNNTPSSL